MPTHVSVRIFQSCAVVAWMSASGSATISTASCTANAERSWTSRATTRHSEYASRSPDDVVAPGTVNGTPCVGADAGSRGGMRGAPRDIVVPELTVRRVPSSRRQRGVRAQRREVLDLEDRLRGRDQLAVALVEQVLLEHRRRCDRRDRQADDEDDSRDERHPGAQRHVVQPAAQERRELQEPSAPRRRRLRRCRLRRCRLGWLGC